MEGKLIVIDGLDGSGKTTQINRLEKHFEKAAQNYKTITFPDYNEKSSTLVKMYLKGEIGGLNEVNAYAASTFYAADRYISYKRHWQKNYEGGSVIIAGRYSTSNAIHQMSKLPQNEWDSYLDWLSDYEYVKLALPKPDMVIFLDMPPEISKKMIEQRYNGDENKKDIHEADYEYLVNCRKAALYAAKKQNWCVISCSDGINPYPVETITQQLVQKIGNLNLNK